MSTVSILPAVQWVSRGENPAGWSAGPPAHHQERPPPTDRAHGGRALVLLLLFPDSFSQLSICSSNSSLESVWSPQPYIEQNNIFFSSDRVMSYPSRRSCELRSSSWRTPWPKCAKNTRCCGLSLNRTWQPMNKQVLAPLQMHLQKKGKQTYSCYHRM